VHADLRQQILLVLLLQLWSNPDRILRRLHWIKYRKALNTQLFPLCNLLQSSSPRYLCDLITVQPSRSTRSSTLVTLLQPSVHSSLKITNRSFRHAAPHLWSKLPPTLCLPYQSGALYPAICIVML